MHTHRGWQAAHEPPMRNNTFTHLNECAVREIAHDWLLEEIENLHKIKE